METKTDLQWRVLGHDPLVLEAKAAPKVEYHVTIADDGEIRGQRCYGWRQTWVSDVAQSYDEAKQFCNDHFRASQAAQ
ncbi:MAG: hypothetical protein KAH44_31840 [Oricola sp.]|jgi:hypothetical protein|nr:hypothetical protein [Oricola sp.]